MILACDAGGTKTSIGLFESSGTDLRRVHVATYESRAHGSLAEIVDRFLSNRSVTIEAAAFGVPGPVLLGYAHATNLPWDVSADQLARQLKLPSVALINDLEAHAWAIERLGPSDLDILQRG